MEYHSKFSRFALECTLEYYEILDSRFALEHRYIRADRANEIESVVIPEMQASGIELDEIFIQQYVLYHSFVAKDDVC